MATLTINNSNSPTAMRLRLTYSAGAGSISITKIESCRTDSYSTSATVGAGFTMKVAIGSSTTNVTLTNIKFNANSSYNTASTQTITNSNCAGSTTVKITFTGSGNTNINNSSFSTSINAGYKSPSMSISNTARTLNTATFKCTYSNATPTQIQIYNNTTGAVAYSGTSLTPTVTGLTPNKTYSFKVRGYANGTWGSYSGSINVTTLRQAYFGTINNINNESSEIILTAANPSGATNRLTIVGYNNDPATLTTLYDSIDPHLGSSSTTLVYALTDEMVEALNEVASNKSQIDIIYTLTTTQNNVTYTSTATGKYNLINSNPTITNVTYQDTNTTTTSVTNNNQKIIVGYSNVSVTFDKMTTLNGGTEGSYNIILNNNTIGSITGNGSSSYTYNVGIIPTSTSTLQIEAVDGRQLSGKISVPLDLIEYTIPAFGEVKAIRTNYVEEQTTLTASGTFTNIFTNNIQSIQYQYREQGTTNWSTLKSLSTYTVTNNSWSISSVIDGDTAQGYDVEKSYDIQIIVTDKISNNSIIISLSSISPLVWYDKENKKLGINKKPDYEMDVGGSINADNLIVNNRTPLDEIDDINTLLNGLVYTESVNLATNMTIAANTQPATQVYHLTPRTGYKPIFVALENTWGGHVTLWYLWLDTNANTISWRVRNNTSSQLTGFTIRVNVLYIKSSCFLAHYLP